MPFWGQRQVGALGAKTKAKPILQLLGSLAGFNHCPWPWSFAPCPVRKAETGLGTVERGLAMKRLREGRDFSGRGAGVSRTEATLQGAPLVSTLHRGLVLFLF